MMLACEGLLWMGQDQNIVEVDQSSSKHAAYHIGSTHFENAVPYP